jgi:hypothetical protein
MGPGWAKNLKFLMGPGWAKKSEIFMGPGWEKKEQFIELIELSSINKVSLI